MAGRPRRGMLKANWQPRPPFEPGNDVNVTHGGYSDALVAPEAERVRAEMQVSGPEYLREPMFGPAVRLVASDVARAERVAQYVDGLPLEEQIEPPKPGTSAPVELARKMDAHALNGLSKLGLTPDSAAKMTRQMTGSQVDIAKMMADIQEEDGTED
jgi:hypothetical protein